MQMSYLEQFAQFFFYGIVLIEGYYELIFIFITIL